MGNIQALNNIDVLLANIITKSCKEKIDDSVNTNDLLHNIGYRALNKNHIIKLGRDDDLNDFYKIASYCRKEIILNKIKNENQFSLQIGPF